MNVIFSDSGSLNMDISHSTKITLSPAGLGSKFRKPVKIGDFHHENKTRNSKSAGLRLILFDLSSLTMHLLDSTTITLSSAGLTSKINFMFIYIYEILEIWNYMSNTLPIFMKFYTCVYNM